jgi:MerR family copper efflux transcriptional regulator
MRIGEVATQAGVSVQAVRFYERRGIVPSPARRASGYREYPPRTVRQVRLIRWAQSLGFKLDELTDVISIGQSHLRGQRATIKTRVAAKLSEVEDALRRLSSMRKALLALAACRCDGDCPIVARALGTPAPSHTKLPLRGRR